MFFLRSVHTIFRSVCAFSAVSISTVACDASKSASVSTSSKSRGIGKLGDSTNISGLKTGYINSAQGLTPVLYRVSGDTALIEDDVRMPLSKIQDAPTQEKGSLYLFTGGTLWPSGRVPYVVDSNFCCNADLQNAFQTWQQAGLQFVPKTANDINYIQFITDPTPDACGWADSIGVKGGRQTISIRPSNGFCSSTRTVIHEIGHGLGFMHEHTRPDRDSYVYIPPSEANDSQNAVRPGRPLGTYDVNSIMHYGSDQVDGMVNRATNQPIERKRVASQNDIKRAADLYGGSSAPSSAGTSGAGGSGTTQTSPSGGTGTSSSSATTLSSIAPLNACWDTVGVNDSFPQLIRDNQGIPGFACNDPQNLKGKPIIVCRNSYSTSSCLYTGYWWANGAIIDPSSIQIAQPTPMPTPPPVVKQPSVPRSYLAPMNACRDLFGIYDSFPRLAVDNFNEPVFVCKFGAYAPYPVIGCYSSTDSKGCYFTGMTATF